MADYRISFTLTAANVNQIKKRVQEALGVDITAQIQKVERQPSRSDRLSEAAGWLGDVKRVVEEVKDELTESLDNMPEGLRENSETAQVNGEAVDSLDTALTALEDVELDDIEVRG